jgi:hypothetical protein
LAFCLLYQSVTGPFPQPEEKSRGTGLLKNRALVAEMAELDGPLESFSAKRMGSKEELRKDSSKSARLSSMDGEKR